jgi:DNA-binding protein HU-beta
MRLKGVFIHMKKEEFIKLFAEESGTTQKEAEKTLDALTSSLLHVFEQGEGLALRGFGNFEVKERAARVGRNPQDGTPVEIPAHKVVTFKAGKDVKEALK